MSSLRSVSLGSSSAPTPGSAYSGGTPTRPDQEDAYSYESYSDYDPSSYSGGTDRSSYRPGFLENRSGGLVGWAWNAARGLTESLSAFGESGWLFTPRDEISQAIAVGRPRPTRAGKIAAIPCVRGTRTSVQAREGRSEPNQRDVSPLRVLREQMA